MRIEIDRRPVELNINGRQIKGHADGHVTIEAHEYQTIAKFQLRFMTWAAPSDDVEVLRNAFGSDILVEGFKRADGSPIVTKPVRLSVYPMTDGYDCVVNLVSMGDIKLTVA